MDISAKILAAVYGMVRVIYLTDENVGNPVVYHNKSLGITARGCVQRFDNRSMVAWVDFEDTGLDSPTPYEMLWIYEGYIE